MAPDPVERRILAALRRLHRREPLREAFRSDRVVQEARAVGGPRPAGHRGAQAPDEEAVIASLGSLVDRGEVIRSGRMVRLAEHEASLDDEMRARVDALLQGLRATGAAPPRVDGIASRLGIPPPVVRQMREAGELVTVAPGIDYPRDTWEELDRRIADLGERGPLNVARVRDGLRTSRRHAEALLAYRRGLHHGRRDRRGVR